MKNLKQIINNSKLWYLLEIIETDWSKISKQPLPQIFIEKYQDKLDWFLLFRYQKLNEEFIEKYINIAGELQVNQMQYPEESLKNIFTTYFWDIIQKHQKLSEEFIEKHIDKINWKFILKYQKLSEEFIEKHIDKLDWKYISRCRQISKSFIKKYKNKLNQKL